MHIEFQKYVQIRELPTLPAFPKPRAIFSKVLNLVCELLLQIIYMDLFLYLVDDLDVPPENDESDRVDAKDFWRKIEQMHVAKGLTGMYICIGCIKN